MTTASVTRRVQTCLRPSQRAAQVEKEAQTPPLEPVEFSLPALTEEQRRRNERDSWGDLIRPSAVPLLPEVGSLAPEVMSRLASTRTDLPEVGGNFLDFHLLAELGRGAFGRVFLARQGDLANRLVALKISTESLTESQKLAQLQHTHIVPIYSFHQAGAIQAVCMPFLGSTTLADVLVDLQQRKSLPVSGKGLVSTLHERKSRTAHTLDSLRSAGSLPAAPVIPATVPATRAPARTGGVALQHLEGLTYVEAVLWLGVRLADGLAHAHERGILHRDLKPANILLTDDGQPLLLDFNLAEDIKQTGGVIAAMLGGTLPYMAPEHLDAFVGNYQTVDHRADIYALGLILVELLLGRHPFTRFQGAPEIALTKMLEERRRGLPPLRAGNPAISPAVEAILHKCLEPDPDRRYSSAEHLREDLERQLNHQPLRHTPEPSLGERLAKWSRRHPRLTSASTLSAFFLVLVAALGVGLVTWWVRASRLASEAAFAGLKTDAREDRIYFGAQADERAEGAAKVRQALAPYVNLENADPPKIPTSLQPEEQDAFRSTLAELLVLLAELEREPRPAQALAYSERAASILGEKRVSRAIYLQQAALLADLKRDADRTAALEKAEGSNVHDAWEHFFLGKEHLRQDELAKAIEELKATVAQDRTNVAAWYLLGNCYLEAAANQMAEKTDPVVAYTRCLEYAPRFPALWVNRGLAYVRMQHYGMALDDFNEALRLRPELAEVYLHRALVQEALKKPDLALADVSEAIRRGYVTHRALLVRARLRLAEGDRAGSKKDRADALALEPRDEESFLVRGVARIKTADVTGALADFKEAVVRNSRSLGGFANQAYVQAVKLNQPREAIATLDRLLRMYPKLARIYADRGVLYARVGDRAAAVRDAQKALRVLDSNSLNSAETVYQVGCVYALTSAGHAADREVAIGLLKEALKKGYGYDQLDKDPELAPLRNDPAFLDMVKAARTLQGRTSRRN